MARMKRFLFYLIIFVTFFIFTNIMIKLATKKVNKNAEINHKENSIELKNEI